VDAQVVLNAYQGLVEEHLSGVLHSIRAVAMSSEAKRENGFECSGSFSDQSNQVSKASQPGLAAAQRRQSLPFRGHFLDQALPDKSTLVRNHPPTEREG
jgi:hypothetical protein